MLPVWWGRSRGTGVDSVQLSARVHHHAESYEAVSPVGQTLRVKSRAQLIQNPGAHMTRMTLLEALQPNWWRLITAENYPAFRDSVQGCYVQHLAWGDDVHVFFTCSHVCLVHER
jgi:hypothetical protein